MSYSDKIKLQNPLTAPVEAEAEDETIIDLVDEIPESSPIHALSPLERQLLNIEEEIPPAEEPPIDLAELDAMDFVEEEDPAAVDLPQSTPEVSEADFLPLEEGRDQLDAPGTDDHSAETEKNRGAATRTNDHRAGFDEQLREAEGILNAATPLMKAAHPESEEEDIELLDIEDGDIDDEIVWFDDLDKELRSGEAKLDAGTGAEPLFEPEPDTQPDSSAADIFTAHMESGLAAAGETTSAAPLSPPAAPVNSFRSLLPPEPPPSETPVPAETLGLAVEEIEAAVERVLERRLGGGLQSMIREAIEAAVSSEIQRLKALLLEDDAGDRTP